MPNEEAEMSSDELNLVEGAGVFALVPVSSIQADRVHFPTARFHFTQAKCRSKQHDFMQSRRRVVASSLVANRTTFCCTQEIEEFSSGMCWSEWTGSLCISP